VRAVVAIGIALLVGCSSAGPSDPATPSGSVAASPSGDDIRPLVGDGAGLEPGRYRFDPFEPSTTFEVDEGWVGGHTLAEFFDVFHGEELSVGFARPGFVMGADGRVDVAELTPRSALETIEDNGVRAEPIQPTELAGIPGFVMSFSVTAPTLVFGGPEGELTLDPSWEQRAIALDVDGALVIVLVQWTADATTGDRAAAEHVLASIRFD
jgi:hypothetical protein